jgi:fatty-acid desaturase
MSLLLFCSAYYLAGSIAIVVGYHRGLAHRSFRARPWFERMLVTLGLPAGTPVQWAGNHRFHHAQADGPVDIHSPHFGGFWHAHCGWYIGSRNAFACLLYALAGPLRIAIDAWLRPRTNQQFNSLARDVAADPYCAALSRPRPYALAMAAHAGLPLAFTLWFWGPTGVAAWWLTLALAYNCGDAIDSVAHLWGGRPFADARDKSANGWIMALLTFGDGWHANHHRWPGSARAGIGPLQPDAGWMTIRLMERLGLAWDVVVLPRPPPIDRR